MTAVASPERGRYRGSVAALVPLLAAVLLAGFAGCSVAPRRASPPTPEPLTRLPPPPANLDAIPDAVPRAEPRARFGNPPFYDVMGRRYVLLASADGYVERGVASWYGPDFHGIATSTGEPYDMYGMTAAHKTLPLPCYARVTNLRNGRSVVVRINDRGPFIGNRVIDLSYTAALKLDMIRDGTALVEVRTVGPGASSGPLLAGERPAPVASPSPDPSPSPAPNPRPGEPPSPGAAPMAANAAAVPASGLAGTVTPQAALYVQAGAFAEEFNARRLLERLRAAGLASAFIGPKVRADRTLFRVRLGPVASVEEFDRMVARLAMLGIPDARLALD